MASTSYNQTPSSSTSSPSRWDVFLSFRGIDTRYTFTDYLYDSLHRSGIQTFRDDPELRSGDVISDALLQAIHESKTYIVVVSKNYASSSWCLDELVAILDCHKTMKRSVIVVFYKIDPSVVRHQTGRYKKAFRKHVTRFDTDRINKWRVTLTNVGNISGYQVYRNMSQVDVINKVVDRVFLEINPMTLEVAKYPVGLDSRIKDITTLFSSDTKGVIRIGIHGMAGVGKTTLAKAVYNQHYHRFQGSCFLANVRKVSVKEKGLVCLQQQLINDVLKCKNIKIDNVDQGMVLIRARICLTKVLIVIDDLDDPKPLEYLEGPFGFGSIIIITTRNEDLLDSINVEARYKVNELGDFESRQLFFQHAFGDNKISDTFTELSKEILECAGGLPLALNVFGSNLLNQPEEGWRWFVDKLKRVSIDDVEKKLLISFDALKLVDPMLQDIFLDIACFFIGREKEEVVKIMETCYTFVNRNIDILKKRCLLTINNQKELGMHDLVRDMGRQIARNHYPDEPGKHSRLWVSKDIRDVLKMHEGTEAIEGIIPSDFYYYHGANEGVSFDMETFKRMRRLRFLFLKHVNLTGSFEQTFENLRLLYWDCCPLKCLPSEFHPQRLVILELPSSKMRTMWELNMASQVFEKLKTLNMPYSRDLTTTPDFTKLPYLESLDLMHCKNLEDVHISIGSLVRLVSLNLCGCVNLKSLQDTICNLRALEVLSINNCRSLEALPTELGNIESLKELNAEGLTVSILPVSIGRLNNLVSLILNYNKKLETLPDTICNLRALEVLSIRHCKRLEGLPIELGNIKSLKQLDGEGLTISKLPISVGRLGKLVKLILSLNRYLETIPDTICNMRALEVLNIDNCRSLEALPIELGNIESLKELNAWGLTVSKLPDSIVCLSKLVDLRLSYNRNLETLPDTICNLRSLETLDISGCKKLEILPDQLWKITRLRNLHASGATLLRKLPDIISSQIPLSLHRLELSMNVLTALPSGISRLSNLEVLDLKDCCHLLSIEELPPNLKLIRAKGCTSLCRLVNLSNLKQLEVLDLTNCSSLIEIQGLKKLTSITELRLEGCDKTILAYAVTKRLFQIYSGFGHEIKIYTRSAEIPDWMSQSRNLELAVSLDLPPNVSHNFLATILCFEHLKNPRYYTTKYSVKNTTSDLIRTDRVRHYGALIIIVPRSIFPIRDGDARVELTAYEKKIGIHLLYNTENKMIDEYDSTTVNVEDELSYPSKRLKIS